MKKGRKITVTGEITMVRVLKNREKNIVGIKIKLMGFKDVLFLNPGFANEYAVLGNNATAIIEERIAGITGYTDKNGESFTHGIDPETGKYYEIKNIEQLPEDDERRQKFEDGEPVFLQKDDKLKPGLIDFYSESETAAEDSKRIAYQKAETAAKIEAKQNALLNFAEKFGKLSSDSQANVLKLSSIKFE